MKNGGLGVLGKKPEGARSFDGQKRYGICLHLIAAHCIALQRKVPRNENIPDKI